jgi:simple sugar transport system permease protein
MTDYIVLLLSSALITAAPLILAGLGETLLERSGAGFSLGIEGILLCGALAAVLTGSQAGPWAGLVSATVVGGLFGLLYSAATALGLDVVLVGIAISILGTGLSTYLAQVAAPVGHTNPSSPLLPSWQIPGLAQIPVIGAPFRVVGAGLWIALVLTAVTAWTLRQTRFGLRLRAASEYSTATQRGIPVYRYRLAASVASGAFTGAAGAVLVLGSVGVFTPMMSGGRGFLVLAIVILGRRTPVGVLAAAGLFALIDGLALAAQTRNLGLPVEIYYALPYLAAPAVMCWHARQHIRRRTKTALQVP